MPEAEEKSRHHSSTGDTALNVHLLMQWAEERFVSKRKFYKLVDQLTDPELDPALEKSLLEAKDLAEQLANLANK